MIVGKSIDIHKGTTTEKRSKGRKINQYCYRNLSSSDKYCYLSDTSFIHKFKFNSANNYLVDNVDLSLF